MVQHERPVPATTVDLLLQGGLVRLESGLRSKRGATTTEKPATMWSAWWAGLFVRQEGEGWLRAGPPAGGRAFRQSSTPSTE